MSILDWDIYVDFPGNLLIFTDTAAPEIGTGSLAFGHINTVDFTHANLVPTDDSAGLSHGVAPNGRLRTVCRVDIHEGGTPLISYFGVTALQSQDDLTAGGSCYALLLASGEGLVDPVLCLHKFTSGLPNGLPTPPLISIPFPVTLGVPFAMELEWIVDVPNLGGTFLLARTGTQTDFSDLTAQMSFVDTSSPITTSVAEGVVASFKSNSVSDTKKVIFDNTTLFELT